METRTLDGHNVMIQNLEHMKLTGVVKVISLEPERVELETTKSHMIIKGQDLHTEKLDIEKGELQLAGTIQGLLYSGKRGKKGAAAFAKRLFR